LAVRDIADKWWEDYSRLAQKPPWRELVARGFRGYRIDPEHLDSPESLRELLRALRSDNFVYSYNAARLLNALADTHFDLDQLMLTLKYSMHPIVHGLPHFDAEKCMAPLIAFFEKWVAARAPDEPDR